MGYVHDGSGDQGRRHRKQSRCKCTPREGDMAQGSKYLAREREQVIQRFIEQGKKLRILM